MPFTPSHIAAVLPLRKRGLSFAALAIGAMSPDFSYMLAIAGPRIDAHSPWGLFSFCIPATLLVWGVYRFYLQPSWRTLFPWLERETDRGFGIIVLSAAIGAFTHLVWDSFTHRYGWPVQNGSWLMHEWFAIGGSPYRSYRILQHLSSLVGLCFLVRCFVRETRAPRVSSWRTLRVLVGVWIGCALLYNVGLYREVAELEVVPNWERVAVQAAFRILSALATVLAAYPLGLRLWSWLRFERTNA